jgi:tripartite-type tricarboxylate transporter receptor subunit TctC
VTGLKRAATFPDVHRRIATEGAEPLPTTPDEYAADIDREETKWSALVKKSRRQGELTIIYCKIGNMPSALH